jgi:type II secretory pathway component PulF
MGSLLMYGFSVFFLVSATVYLVLVRSRSGLPDGEGFKKLQSGLAGYYTLQSNAQSPVRLQPELSRPGRLLERVKKNLKGLFSVRVSSETEILYFVLQFLMYIESGMTVMSALKKTQAAMDEAGYGIAAELQKINFKLSGGVPFIEAIKVLENKRSVGVMKEFFLVISQAQEIGVPVSHALKNAIKEFEELRIIRAEQRASRLSVLLAVPIVFGFLPAILLLVLMPAVHGLFKAFG